MKNIIISTLLMLFLICKANITEILTHKNIIPYGWSGFILLFNKTLLVILSTWYIFICCLKQ